MVNYSNNEVGTLHLNREETIQFINAFLRPSSQQVERMSRIRERIDNSVSTIDTDYGFQAIVNDLDLSFLENDDTREYSVKVQMTFDTENTFYESISSNSVRIGSYVYAKRNIDSNSTFVDELLKTAA